MGNSALIVVVASVLSGILILMNIHRINVESNVVQTHLQEEVLARELAHTGLSLVLAKMYTTDGLAATMNLGNGPSLPYQGGNIFVQDYINQTEAKQIDFKVRGEYGDAQYLIHSRYKYEVDFPFAVYADSPYLKLITDEASTIYGGPDADINKLKLGTSEYERIEGQDGLSGLIDMNGMVNGLKASLNTAWDGLPGEMTEVEQLSGNETFANQLPDIDPTQNSPWLEEFYYQTLDKMQIGIGGVDDAYYKGLADFGAIAPEMEGFGQSYSFGSPDLQAIVRVDGDMIVRAGSSVSGNGILLVEGNLTVEAGAMLDWNGIVYLRPEKTQSTTSLQGNVSIDGALVAFQEALPPGSHMDVTSNRNIYNPWPHPRGNDKFDSSPVDGPWYSHRHKWNADWNSLPAVSIDREVFFRTDGGPSTHESSLGFNKTLNDIQALGIPKIYLEFVNPGQSGMGVYEMMLQGDTEPRFGRIAAGFNGSGSLKSEPFAPSELIDLNMNFRSLRMLKLMLDPENTTIDGPHRIANDFNREKVFYVAIRNAENDALLMTTSVYQHIRVIENAEYQKELDKLRDDIIDGNFGLTIDMGPGAAIRYDNVAASSALTRTGYSAFAHIGTWTRRCNGSDYNCDLAVN